MKKFIYLLYTAVCLCACQTAEDLQPDFYQCQYYFADSSFSHVHNAKYQAFLNSITQQGVVGVNMAIYQPQSGMWVGASGKADIHNQVNLHPCNISRMGSTVKMFTATVILQLQEEGKIHLEDKISAYLQGEYMQKIENAEEATIQQLLQHTGGMYNYIQNLSFQTASLNDLIREWEAEDLLKYAYNQPAYFKPGADVRYSNTHYILLGLLIEKIEEKPLYQVFDEKIIHPLGLTNTQFAGKNPVPQGIIRGYIDIYSNMKVLESTYFSGWDYYTADGGLISNPYDMSLFFQALMQGHILQASSLSQMLQWKTPQEVATDFFPIHYGLGIFKIETPQGIAYMHSGDAIGYYANMLYFPSDSTTIVYAVNSNYGKIDAFVSTQEAIQNFIQLVK